MTNLNINLKGIRTRTRTALFNYVSARKKPNKIFVLTYTLSYEGLNDCNELSNQGIKVHVVYNTITGCCPQEAQFFLKQNNENHTKLWLIDKQVFVGSTNLVGDTIGNIMIEVENKTDKKDLQHYYNQVLERTAPKETYFV